MLPTLTAAARERGFQVRFHEVSNWENQDPLFAQIKEAPAQALMSYPMPQSSTKRYVELTIRQAPLLRADDIIR